MRALCAKPRLGSSQVLITHFVFITSGVYFDLILHRWRNWFVFPLGFLCPLQRKGFISSSETLFSTLCASLMKHILSREHATIEESYPLCLTVSSLKMRLPSAKGTKWSESCSVMSDFSWPHGLYSPWNSPGQKTGVFPFLFSRESSQPRDWTQVSHIAGRFFTSWGTREALGTKGRSNNC